MLRSPVHRQHLESAHEKAGSVSVAMKETTHFSTVEARKISEDLAIDWNKIDFDQFTMGLEVELEHGERDPETNVTNNNPLLTGKIALAHLNEFPDYYTRLAKLEKEAEQAKQAKH